MPQKETPALQAFNRGIVSSLALARTDIKRMALSAEEQVNWMPRTLGSMMLRPGLRYINSTRNDSAAVHIPFVFSSTDKAIIEITDQALRVRVDETIITRASVSSTVTNGTFDTDLTGWTDSDEPGATSQWAAGGYMSLAGDGTNAAIRIQQVTVSVADRNVRHALEINISRGPVSIRVGSSSGDDDYISEAVLGTGVHSLSFIPTGNFYVYLFNRNEPASYLDSISVASSGPMVLAAPWLESDLSLIRYDQSADIIYLACDGYQQYKIERRGTYSWSLVKYQPEDGPFLPLNTTLTTITPSDLSGDITLTASQPLFRPGHVGGLFRIASSGQKVSDTFSSANEFTEAIRVTNVGGSRAFAISIAGTFTATLTLQRSISEEGNWEDVTTYTTAQTISYNDTLDNQIVFYRIGIKTGDYTSGSVTASLIYSLGSITGVVRITDYNSRTSVAASVLSSLGNITASADWNEAEWSDYRGYPSAVTFYEGRLWWAGKDKIFGSVSDAFQSFDDTTEGDSGPISRSIGSGPVDRINWLLPLLRLIVGGAIAEHTARSSSLDEPLSPTSFSLKSPSTRGSSPIQALKLDGDGIFVRNSRLFQLSFNETYSVTADYSGTDLTIICPEVGQPTITRIAVQRYPDTRIHCVRSDGKVAVLIFDPAEEVKCWILVETDGDIEDVVVLPADDDANEDSVYYLVKRTVNSATKRYLECWALESECQGGTYIYDGASTLTIPLRTRYPEGTLVTARSANGTKIGTYTVTDQQITLGSAVTYAAITPTLYKLADSFLLYSGTATTTISGLSHLEGADVVVWADGKDFSPLDDGAPTTFTVSGGSITLPEAVTNAVIGLHYEARFKSTKLAYAAVMGTALTKVKRADHLGLILKDTHVKGLRYGPDFDTLDDLPTVEDGAAVDDDYVWPTYDKDSFSFNGDYLTDPRICLHASAPRPVTVLAAVPNIATYEKG